MKIKPVQTAQMNRLIWLVAYKPVNILYVISLKDFFSVLHVKLYETTLHDCVTCKRSLGCIYTGDTQTSLQKLTGIFTLHFLDSLTL